MTYGVLYYGVRSFTTSDGLEYLPGDVDGDGVVSGETDFSALDAGGEMTGTKCLSIFREWRIRSHRCVI